MTTGTLSDVDELRRLHEQDDPRTIEEIRAADSWQEGTVTDATLSEDGESWSVSWREERECRNGGQITKSPFEGSMGAGCPARDWLEIKPGDIIRFYGKGFGYPFHGIDVNGREVFYRTPWEQLAERVRWLAEYDRRKRERIVSERRQVDAWLPLLHGPYRERIERFRREKPSFDMDGGTYEVYPVLMAQRIEAWVHEQNTDLDEPVSWDVAVKLVKELEQMSHKQQAKVLHAGQPDEYGVSGHQVDSAFGMAAAVLSGRGI